MSLSRCRLIMYRIKNKILLYSTENYIQYCMTNYQRINPPIFWCSAMCLSVCCYLVTKSYPKGCDPGDCSPPGSSAHGILQARILEWVAMSFSRGSSRPRDWTCVSCIGRWILYCWATREVPRIKQSFITKPWAQLLASEFSGAGRKLGEQWS